MVLAAQWYIVGMFLFGVASFIFNDTSLMIVASIFLLLAQREVHNQATIAAIVKGGTGG